MEWLALPEGDGLALLEGRDDWAEHRNALRLLAKATRNWAGIPTPVGDLDLVIEPSFPKAEKLMELGALAPRPEAAQDLPPDVKFRNSFWSKSWRCHITVWEEGGRICWTPGSLPSQADQIIGTLGASFAWGIEQEARAVRLLAELIPHHAFKQYLLTGSFMETSQRSGLVYVFRKLRPTVVLSFRDKRGRTGGRIRILSTLCLHPIGYYQSTWAGAMCPTDDVVAHLMMMRGDEPKFWARSSQHHPSRPEAGL